MRSQERCHVITENQNSELAINAGTPVRKQPFAPWPQFSADELAAACAVLRSGKVNYWTGEEGVQFEKEFAAYTGCRYAIAVANGTVALELSLKAMGIGLGDEVVVPSRTFIASASAAVTCGATPVMADVDRESQNLTAASIKPALSPRTRAIIVVHLAGWPCDMDPILDLAREHKLKVLEDCAQAHGAAYKGRKVGSIGDAGAFSFCQDKIMSTGGEGGMITTSDETIFKAAWSYKDHGKNYDAMHPRTAPPDFRWVHDGFGTNGRLTEMQAAIGRVQLRELDNRVAARRANAAALTHKIGDVPGLRMTVPPPEVNHAYYKYYAFLQPEDLRRDWDRDRVAAALRAEGIPCSSGSCSEIYLEKAFELTARPRERLPVARELGETSLMFLVHPTLVPSDMLDAARAIRKVLNVAVNPVQRYVAA
ncbi:MAG TPA: DegT/DnrJ/EryC1/StrS family aminotransferase [Candidatus Polarisedimenticolia bacterium]|nr:DegT/DnrJ/EryC1/StrS family aminotransferase [Candidatus Polarisedimenticolia bacterium]